jgi:hypothetical protein
MSQNKLRTEWEKDENGYETSRIGKLVTILRVVTGFRTLRVPAASLRKPLREVEKSQ